MGRNLIDISAAYSDEGASRAARKRARAAADFKPDPRIDEMRRLAKDDPDGFDRVFGGIGRIILGHADAAAQAASPEGAA